jgi:autotransporter translocation and assembly factor TamB
VLQVDKKQEQIKGKMKTTTRFGNMNSRFSLDNIFQDPGYSVQADLAHVDLSKFPGNKELQSDLNLSLKTTGKGTDPDSMNTNIDLDVTDSYFLDKPVKAVNLALEYDRGSYSLRNFSLNSEFADIQAAGEGHIREMHSLQYEVQPKNLRPLHDITGFPQIDIQGNVSGGFEGTRGSLNLAAEYDFFDVHYDTLKTSRLQGNLSVLSRDSLISGDIDVTADSVYLNNQNVKQISVNSSYDNNVLKNRIQLTVNDTLSLFTQTDVRTMDDPVFTIHELQVNIVDEVWQSSADSTRITMGEDSILIDDFRLRSREQIIGLNGTLALKGQENLNFRLENLDISRLPQSVNPGSPIYGIVNSEMHLGGSAASPELKGNLNIENLRMDTIHFERFTSNFQYVSDTLNFQGNVDLKSGRPLQANLTMPLSFSLTDSFSMPDRNTPVLASLKLDSLELQSINPFLGGENMEVSGMIDAGVDISNTIGEPRFDGKLQLRKGAFSYPGQGISYRNIEIDSRFDNQRFVLDQAIIRSGGGNLKLEGYAELGLSAGNDKQAVRFKIDGKKFRAVRSERLEAYIDPSINIKGTLTDPDVAGNVNISQSRINADAFRRQFSFRSDNPNPPLLVKAMRDTSEKKVNLQPVGTKNNPAPGNIIKNLNLNLNLTIPGNTWVRGNDMNFELSGNLRAIMQAEQIDLFGTLNIQRGFFEFYGKKFDFVEGSLTLTGSREIDPMLNLILGYDFRDPDRELHTLTLHVEGRTSQPQLSFALDGKTIREKEAFSYLLFGKAPGRLTAGEQMSLEENAANIARSLAIGKVTGIVTGSLKSSLGLDVVEVGGGKTWKSGSVKIGKYITEDLYLSYKQTFAFDKREKVIEPERITLDYQLTRSLFLQATNQMPNSGFDLIFKKSWK